MDTVAGLRPWGGVARGLRWLRSSTLLPELTAVTPSLLSLAYFSQFLCPRLDVRFWTKLSLQPLVRRLVNSRKCQVCRTTFVGLPSLPVSRPPFCSSVSSSCMRSLGCLFRRYFRHCSDSVAAPFRSRLPVHSGSNTAASDRYPIVSTFIQHAIHTIDCHVVSAPANGYHRYIRQTTVLGPI